MTHTTLFFDFESYYDDQYSLKKLTPAEYILDPRFEAIGCSFKTVRDGVHNPAIFVEGPNIPLYLSDFDPAKTGTVAFNALFDNCILAWRYGFLPARMVCTMRLAVALRGHLLQSASLASVGKLLGVGTKGTAIADAKGLHRAQLQYNPELWRAYQAYANNDNEMNHDIYYRLMPELPASERRIMDMVTRCAVVPRFMVDTQMLSEHLEDLKRDKVKMLRLAAGAKEEDLEAEEQWKAGAPRLYDDAYLEQHLEEFAKKLRSNGKFEQLLRDRGIDIEYKTSLSDPTVKIPAFAKTDEFMSTLQEHEDPVVQALATGRLGVRSTIEEKRGQRIFSIASLPWNDRSVVTAAVMGTLPVPLKFAGAHTHRLSGDWLMNLQNLPAGRGKNKSKLRLALQAPPGHKVVKADKSQIECRLNAWVCGQHDLLEVFRIGGDPYSRLASRIFGFQVDKNVHQTERFIGKSGELGLGFGCGDTKFYNMVVRSARVLGMDVRELLKVWTPELATKSVRVYRSTHNMIEAAWRTLDQILRTVWVENSTSLPVRFGPCTIGQGYVEGPGGLRMKYANPRWDDDLQEFRFDYGKRSHKMYGPKFLENIVQFIARINTMHDAIRIADRGFEFALQEHDALAWIVPNDQVERCKEIVREEMTRPPSWAPDLPLNIDLGVGQSYGV